MVKATLTGGRETSRRLTCDPTRFFDGQRALQQEGSQGLGLARRLLHDEGGVVLRPDVQDADQPGVLDSSGSPCGVQHAGTVGVFGADDGEGDLALECGVVGGPLLEVLTLG
jgi:hypothetical protein